MKATVRRAWSTTAWSASTVASCALAVADACSFCCMETAPRANRSALRLASDRAWARLAWSRARLASACIRAALAGRWSSRNSRSPDLTSCPSSTFASISWLSMRARTCTVEMGCTVPTAATSMGMAPRRTRAVTTGTGPLLLLPGPRLLPGAAEASAPGASDLAPHRR
nr:hypothetical protein [Nitrospirillum amazonense]